MDNFSGTEKLSPHAPICVKHVALGLEKIELTMDWRLALIATNAGKHWSLTVEKGVGNEKVF
jgi:hypothetical protein